ncbi:non-ribosomal peptide synthetase [Micromonospora echinospora]|uniref:Non-ribosomal peptide synthase domain TIGR01720/amino acid adenylation domain-containing protein n=1 Tax=Micromonospora echinospora TaxID=1877 RepID=A0A1C4YSR3_MICEC|nr:non-ribosomal peptide synthetase [Micromonospora echinospora]OZV77378.1 non-ribosomal peptide synthetase [Micromonospora echinospora]SCF23677.1 non-ribosomal peptide synthase domain TIGR01720/amino acid adenylation domain-containing protein [Micromonospora echinospora]
MTDIRKRLAALSPAQRELVEKRLGDLAATRGAQDDRITPRDRATPAPLGIAQQREWTIERLRGANNIPGAFRAEGELDLPLLGRVLTEVVQRHEVLRSTVDLRSGVPVQIVHPVTEVPIPVVDLSHLGAEQQREELRRRLKEEIVRPFDAAEPLRLRASLVRLAPDVHVALLTTDHAASDASSWNILVQELVTLYGLRHHGDGADLPPPDIQFGDFAAWQRAQFDDERLAAELAHWQQTLDGIPAGIALPTDRPYPARPTYAGDFHIVNLPPELAAAIRRFSERERVSLFPVLLAACSLWLYRFLEQDDLVIGELVAGRTRSETERLIGCFANPLPLRMRLSEKQTLREVVQQARDTMVTAYDHQDVPFDRLISALGLGREATQTSLSRLWINILTLPESTLEVAGLRISPEPFDLGLASVDLTLSAMPLPDTLQLQWQYMTELFDADTVSLLAEQFQTVLRQLVTTPDLTVEQVELTVEPIAAVPASTDATASPGFVELFQRRVTLTPHAPAVVCDGHATSYAELNRSANQLARHLRERGVGRDTPVGILVDRSAQLAVAILGVLKAGGAYVPLDSTYPPDRIGYILADAGVRVLITQEALATDLTAAGVAPPGETVLLDALPSQSGENLPETPDHRSVAYIVYTSGSTGRPKGAMIEHGSLATFARDIVDRLGLGAGDRFLQFASPSFDVLVEELFPIWVAGGAVVIPTGHIISGQVDLVDLIDREKVSVIELPTAYWHEWVRELDRLGRHLPDRLRLVIIGGERVLSDRLVLWQRLGVPLLHVYGLTETTVSSTFFHLDPADPVHDWPNLPIGTPLPSADLRILNSRLRPVPPGGTGELYIGGVSLARGYLGRPGLTAQRFIADPQHPGQRLYRTGDLVRRRADGNLEFISRVDTQIKIRGFRVEPAEIESALSRHPQVLESVVVLHEPVPGDRRLVAYVVPPTGGEALNVGDLRQFLERELPSYMVPSTFVELDALPLNANGKVDRDRLPAPGTTRLDPDTEYVAPQTPVQQKLASIIAGAVGIERLGMHDNFFEVGGDSILAIQVVARAQEEGLRFEPFDLFVHPTVALLADAVTVGPVIDAEQGEVSGPVPLTPMQRWFSLAGIAEPHHWNTSALLELRVPVDPQHVRAATESLMVHHDGLRQRVLLAGVRTRARIAPSGDATPFQVHDLSDLDDTAQDEALPKLVARTQATLDPAVGPLARIALVRLGGRRPDRLVVVAHRLVADPASLRILLEDLATALTHLSAGIPVTLPAKTTSWQSWARRLAGYGTTEPVQSQRAYWSRTSGAPGAELPLDNPSDEQSDMVSETRTMTVSLDSAETAVLLRTAPESLDCRIEELLLAALARTLTAWTGSPQHVVDIERHDRERLFDDVDLARTVGWHSRTHPLVLTSDPDSSPRVTARGVRDNLRSVPAGGIGWQLLRQDPDPVADRPAQLKFTHLGELDLPASAGLTVLASPAGADASPDGRRSHIIDVETSVLGARLLMRWRYSGRLHLPETVRSLAERYRDEVRALLGHTAPSAGATPGPADFPLARVDQAQLSRLLGRL